jgi:NNP family nitrate/nitrite transporter-like MFS transporter
MLALGMGNGAVFQLVPQRFKKEIGVMTGPGRHGRRCRRFLPGLVPRIFAAAHGQLPGGLPDFCSAGHVLALVGLTGVKTRWRTTWGASHLTSAKI